MGRPLRGLLVGCSGFVSIVCPAQADDDAIVVTAERREQSARLVPASVSTVGAAELQRIGADHASEILNRSAGVLIHRGNGQEHLTAIRSPVLTGGAGAGSFLFLEDGVPLRSAGFANVNALLEATTETAARIEVVRGPSGAVYGANAIHGVVNVFTPAPEEDRQLAEVSLDTIGRVKARGVASGESAANGFLIAASVLSDPGFRADSGVEQQKLTLRHDLNADRILTRTIFSFANLNQDTAGFLIGPQAYRDRAARRTNDNPNAFRDSRAFRLSTRVDAELSDEVTLSVTPFARFTDQSFILSFFPSQALEENRHWSVGAQSALYIDRPSGVSAFVGFDWEYTEGSLSEVQSLPTIGSFTQGLHYDYRVAAVGVSPFASLTIPATDRLAITAAVRLDRTSYSYENLAPDGVVGRFLRPPDREDVFTTISPKVSAVYDLGLAIFYASYARGARPPQTTDLYRLQINQVDNQARAETIDAVEVGLRGAFGDWLTYNVAGYTMEKDNFFFRDADGFNVPDGQTRHRGAEGEVRARILPTLAFSGNAAFGRHTYRFDRPINAAAQASEAISFGDDVDTAPRWLAGARVSWSPIADKFTAEVEWAHVGAYFTDAANTQTYPGHDLVNLRAEWKLADAIRGFATIRNLGNVLYAERADFAFGQERSFPGEGRVATFGVRLGS